MEIQAGKIIRSRRRSISAEISHAAELVIRAPKWVSDQLIQDFIRTRRSWIEKHLEIARAKKADVPEYHFRDGEEFLYLGNTFPLRVGNYPDKRLDLREGFFCLSSHFHAQARKEFTVWYRAEAARIIRERADYYAPFCGVRCGSIRINQARRQWGSCTAGNRLSFTWRLIMAPLFVVDAVVVHELVHIREKNHSAEFWRQVKGFYPLYDEASAWLDQHSNRMHL